MKLKHILITLQFLLTLLIADNEMLNDACTQCHYEIDDDLYKPVMTNIAEDIHFQVGLGCSDCHGGNPSEADKAKARARTFTWRAAAEKTVEVYREIGR